MTTDDIPRDSIHQFGGDWTIRKLDVVAKYLVAYTTALKNKPFQKAYIDAFAGTGYRTGRATDDPAELDQGILFPDLAGDEPQGLLAGSAVLALKTEPAFERYFFIERDPKRCADLEHLKTDFPNRATQITIQQGDANSVLKDLCAKNWKHRRAVVFLDPYGMQVKWSTIEAIAKTQAIDLWLLFPLGIGVNRMLPRSGNVPESWKNRISLLLGSDNWYDEFYDTKHSVDLFGTVTEQITKQPMDVIGRYFNDRLKTIFAGVADRPGVLYNSAKNPLYLLCFAVGNPRGKDIALRIANNLLKGIKEIH